MKDLRKQLRFMSILMIMLLMAISCKPKTDKLTKEYISVSQWNEDESCYVTLETKQKEEK